MNRHDLRHADINLLVVFETMMRERNVTRAGESLFLGQTTVSCALGRLRSLFNDPLFIRTGRTMEPTARAEEIHARLAPALDGIAVALSSTQAFDPRTCEGTFHVGLSDDVEYALLPRLMRHLRDEAPNITLVVRRVDQRQLPERLASGEISVGISPAQTLPAHAHCKSLRPMHPVLLRADTLPGPLTLDDFCSRPHVVVSSMGNVIDDADHALGLVGRQRKVVLAVPQFSALPALLVGSDMVCIVPDYVAQAMTLREGMRAEEAPVQLPAPDLSMAWRGANHNDPRESWLRACFCRYLGRQSEPSAALAVA
ncbi:LysR family transcriptional regulator [Pseudomonas koreensis]|uniref:LysR family transcriptional regulator n=1 Tax=Pseudomonas koreensis TaxID=198620 RepID=UPI0021CABD47|nr:LysR family transcriptional regulator [Pseudomonas koreensis]MCU0069992.1 LysR family transcriptional regulator [Pseudomonas koreensis]